MYKYQRNNLPIVRQVKDRQLNCQKKDKRTNNYLQNTTQKTKDEQKSMGDFMCSGRVSSFCSTSGTRHVTFKQHERHAVWKSWTTVCVNKYT